MEVFLVNLTYPYCWALRFFILFTNINNPGKNVFNNLYMNSKYFFGVMYYILHDKIEMMDFYKFSIINNLTSRIKINIWKPLENCMVL